MAQAELKSGKDPQMRKMATGIISAQKKEVAQIAQAMRMRTCFVRVRSRLKGFWQH